MANIGFGEDERTEFKEAWSDGVLETLAAFANHRGGRVLVGVRDDGEVLGTDTADLAQRQAADRISHALGVTSTIIAANYVGIPVLEIGVDAARGLVPCRGRYLRRVGSTNRDLSPEQLAQLVLERSGQTWDQMTAHCGIEAVDLAAVDRFARQASQFLPGYDGTDPPQRILENLRLLDDGQLTNAGLMLFGKDPQRRYAGARIHLARFFSNDRYQSDRSLTGTIFRQLDGAMSAFRQLLDITEYVGDMQFDPAHPLDSLRRKVIWPYPELALREAIVNALIHRDYAATGDIQVRIWSDRVEIWSPGELPAGMTLEQILRPGHLSRPRNPLLAQISQYAGIAEHWGTGTTRMIDLCRAHGVPDPTFTEYMAGFFVTFRQAEPKPHPTYSRSTNERQQAAIEYVRIHGSISNAEYRQISGISKSSATRDLELLVELGLLRRSGKTRGRGIHYVIPSE